MTKSAQRKKKKEKKDGHVSNEFVDMKKQDFIYYFIRW